MITSAKILGMNEKFLTTGRKTMPGETRLG